ncbi:hypothetical protein [Nocardia sp. NPDC058480]|uniref:hypothetical protein n=1 Tax=unclassified Nocardia TaxID=2637762 RepID=UPI0036553595
MTTTVGISAEFAVIRGVLLSSAQAARPEVLLSVEQRVDQGGSVVSTLDALTEAEPCIADAAVAYHTPQDRKKLVSQLASGRWQTSSLVSTRSAMFALVGGTPELDEFRTVVLLNFADRTATAVVVGADRGQILASDSWTAPFGVGTAPDDPTGAFDADPMSETIGRVRSMLASIPTHPGVIALCGSAAAEPDIAVLRDELAAPVVLLPDFADATARGAALIAAEQARNQSAAPLAEPRHPRRLPLAAAVAAALLVTSGFAVTHVLDDSPSAMNAGSADTTRPSPPSNSATVIEPTTDAQVPISPADSAPPPAPIPTPAPHPDQVSVAPATAAPSATAPPPAPQQNGEEPAWIPTPTANPTAPSTPLDSPQPTTPSDPTTPTKVGAPDSNGLFPGESPRPPAGADPAVERAWWDNHWNLKQRWLHGG